MKFSSITAVLSGCFLMPVAFADTVITDVRQSYPQFCYKLNDVIPAGRIMAKMPHYQAGIQSKIKIKLWSNHLKSDLSYKGLITIIFRHTLSDFTE